MNAVGLESVLRQTGSTVRLVEVADVRVNPAAYLVMQSTVDVDTDTVVDQVATGLQAERHRVELIQASPAHRVMTAHVPPLTFL